MTDYLWDKTGRDPEIEELEARLGTLRSAVSAAPRIATETDVSGPSGWFSRIPFSFRLTFAGAFGLVLIAALVGTLRLVSIDAAGTSLDFYERTANVGPVSIPDAPSLDVSRAAATKVGTRGMTAPPHVSKISRRSVPKPTRASSAPPAGQMASLTAEERHAYDQLMLALSITSSRLKMVQDIADGNPGVGPAEAAADESFRSN